MKPIKPEKRRVTNIDEGEFQILYDDDGRADGEVLQLNTDRELVTVFISTECRQGTRRPPTSTRVMRNSWFWKANSLITMDSDTKEVIWSGWRPKPDTVPIRLTVQC